MQLISKIYYYELNGIKKKTILIQIYPNKIYFMKKYKYK